MEADLSRVASQLDAGYRVTRSRVLLRFAEIPSAAGPAGRCRYSRPRRLGCLARQCRGLVRGARQEAVHSQLRRALESGLLSVSGLKSELQLMQVELQFRQGPIK